MAQTDSRHVLVGGAPAAPSSHETIRATRHDSRHEYSACTITTFSPTRGHKKNTRGSRCIHMHCTDSRGRCLCHAALYRAAPLVNRPFRYRHAISLGSTMTSPSSAKYAVRKLSTMSTKNITSITASTATCPMVESRSNPIRSGMFTHP